MPADIFISYARENRTRIERLAEALEAEGFAVWWDKNLSGGADFSKETEEKLNAAKAILVAWSTASVDSLWVGDEAGVGREKGNLVPVLIEPVAPKLGFRGLQTIDLAAWRGDPSAAEFVDLVRTLKARISGEPAPAASAPGRRWPARLKTPQAAALAAGSALLLVVLAFAAGPLATSPSAAPKAEEASARAESTAKGAPQAPPASIAVLPFADMSAARDQEYFADGTAEEILNALARIEGLKVTGRTSSFAFKGKNADLKAIGATLGVAHVLEGSVRKQGDRVRVTAQLVKVDDGFHLWSETFDRDQTDIFAVQDEISRAVAEALSVAIGAELPANEGTQNPEAHDLYLRARQLLARRSAGAMHQADDFFKAATVLDPNYSAAYSGRARTLTALPHFEDQADVPAIMAEAEGAANQALAIDPENAEAYSALAQIDWFYHWDWDAADAAMSRAIGLAPNDAEIANFAGDHYRYRSELEKAEAFERRAAELNPLHAINFSDLAWGEILRRRYADALARSIESARLDPRLALGLRARAYAEVRLGHAKEARAALKTLEGVSPKSAAFEDTRGEVAYWLKDFATLDSAIGALRGLAAGGATADYFAATLLAHRGDAKGAAAALEAAYKKRDFNFITHADRIIPEDWPDDPAVRAALDKPELNRLWEIRRKNLAANPRDR